MFCDVPDFGRCCFCLPLRQGILTFAYLNIVVSTVMMAMYSHAVHNSYRFVGVYHGAITYLDDEVSIAIYVVDIVFNMVLLYGGHMKHLICLKTFYYYGLSTFVATVLLQILDMISTGARDIDLIPLFIIGTCIHIYLIVLVRSLLKKLEISGGRFENQLHQFVNGDARPVDNVVYPSTVVPNEVV